MKAKPDTVAGKKFVIIGVHGWFPAKLVRSVMGEPTGTSAKFCEQTAKSLQQYFEQEHDLVLPMNCMTLIPLQWEGKVQERVEKLYSFLVDNPATLDALQSADAIFWTTHSQGTPVSAILLHRLIQNKIIQLKKQPICLLAMAGIAHGPFASLKGSLIVKYFEADAARELFEFMDPSSEISEVFRQAMAYILQQGVKTILVGSMQDQVVPLYSAIMVATEHPNILRAIYIDGHVYSPDDFLINLIVFALRLRNAGLSDHGLLLHISDVLAGNLYAWEGGHSTIYEETSVYKLAPHYLFDTSPLGGLLPNHQENHTTTRTSTMVEAKSELFHTKVRLNPYYLTWAMRGIFDDVRVIQVFGDQLDRLRILFDQWHPTSSKLREIKFRLEPIKARL
ncbi:uncharacterized protein BX664DRAFT_266778 [Halteromyces radiatus]|uniref:uncharacterized protein n=1 Tax=Halteromyces radiatus TaxID=101107 RepID=UPI00222053A1|nr:uncharacterized protein BX664DRAFT_266778 [Halteromyces radiatus]KAI8085179.1 hypothetical protein BX664DRAFT_266778 [Halteromyces radiatus]